MRLLDLADGFSSNTQPIVGALTSSKLVQYISDGAYQSANGTPTGGEIYFNTTTGEVRVYDSTSMQWKTIGQTVLGWQETPSGLVDGVNATFTITYAPINDECLLVYIDGALSKSTDYSYSLGSIVFNTAPSAGQEVYVSYITEGIPSNPSVTINGQFTEYRILTGAEITAKQITLTNTPAEPSKVLVEWIGVTSQIYGTDFVISGNVLSWNGLGLDGVLLAGDNLRIFYLVF